MVVDADVLVGKLQSRRPEKIRLGLRQFKSIESTLGVGVLDRLRVKPGPMHANQVTTTSFKANQA